MRLPSGQRRHRMARPAAGVVFAMLLAVAALPALAQSFLILDDSPVVRRSLARALAELGHREVLVFDAPAAAMAFLEHQPVDMIFVDVPAGRTAGREFVQPDRQSLAFVAWTRARWPGRTQALLVTSPAPFEPDFRHTLELGREAGISDYLVKPFPLEDLRRKIEAILFRPSFPPGHPME